MSYGTSSIAQVLPELFKKDTDILNTRIEELIQENHAAGNPPHGYLYMGEFWSNIQKRQQRGLEKKILHPDLQPKGKAIYDSRKLLLTEWQRLNQGMNLLLRDCHNPQDVRDALPDVAALILPQVRGLKRTRPEAYPIADKSLHMHTYELISGIFKFYAANQLL